MLLADGAAEFLLGEIDEDRPGAEETIGLILHHLALIEQLVLRLREACIVLLPL